MLKAFNPRYILPSRNYFSHTALPNLYAETCEKIKSKLSSNEVNFFSATTDLWTSSAKDPFMSYSIHYISATWVLHTTYGRHQNKVNVPERELR